MKQEGVEYCEEKKKKKENKILGVNIFQKRGTEREKKSHVDGR